MNPGKLNERIRLLRMDEGTSDGRGGYTNSGWVTIREDWAMVEQQHGSRFESNGKTVHEKPYLITMHSRRPNVAGDYDPNDTNPADFDTAVALNELSERFAIYYRGRLIVLHSVIEEDKEVNRIIGYSKKVAWQPATS